jgi:hypothetical protein
MALANTLSPKHFSALVKGLGAKEFFDDADVTVAFLCEQVYGVAEGADATAEAAQIAEFSTVLGTAAKEMWEPSALEAALAAGGLAPEQMATAVNWWRANRARVHDAMFRRSRWAGSIEQLSWRIDIKTAAKDVAGELSDPTAIVHMDAVHPDTGADRIDIEMDREQLAAFEAQLDEIQAKIDTVIASSE